MSARSSLPDHRVDLRPLRRDLIGRDCRSEVVQHRLGAAEPTIDPMSTIYTVPMPLMILPRTICTPSLAAHIVNEKFCWGMPFHRQEQRSRAEGVNGRAN